MKTNPKKQLPSQSQRQEKAQQIRIQIARLRGEMAQIFNVNASALINGAKSKPTQNVH